MKLLLLSILFASATITQAQNINKNYNLDKSGLALSGYDPVAYFTQNKALPGTKAHALMYEQALYYFATAENKKLFKENPMRYLPQYGGWCAYAMGASGEKVEIDPATFKIKDGKLYLFYNKYFNNTLKLWNKDEANLLTKANTQWKKYL